MPIDNTYSFFSGPEFETLPSLPKSKKYVKRESTQLSQPETVNYQHLSAQTTAVEEWVTDTSYGFFSCPSLHPEPVMKEIKPIARVATPPPQHPKQMEDLDGYSFF